LKQAPAQSVSPVGQAGWHVPALQTSMGPHPTPQTPQLLGSPWMLTHLLPQSVHPRAALHWQVPMKQLLPTPPQALPHAPQLFTSNWRKLHAPLQSVAPNWQLVWHVPKLHTWLAAHTLPQLPQLLGSSCRRTQVPLQLVLPILHWQVPLTQLPCAPQLSPHVPQLLVSL
jgi:hypothetical protein